jgi:5-carboxymethyl-2-hydroxymuconate isomerase
MPHIITEYSSNFSQEEIIKLQQNIRDIFQNMPDYFDYDQCKFRSMSFDHYFVGELDQQTSSFIHVTAKILQGRPEEVRKELSDKIVTTLQSDFAKIDNKDRLDISVEIFEMDKSTYNKARIEK